jgi:hypothetical protein
LWQRNFITFDGCISVHNRNVMLEWGWTVPLTPPLNIQSVPGGKANILGGHNICHSEQKKKKLRMSYSEQFPAESYFTIHLQNYWLERDITYCFQNRYYCLSDKLGTVYLL